MIKNRPTEVGTGALGVFAVALAKAIGLDADWTLVLTLVVAGAPTVITWIAVRWGNAAEN